MFSLNPNAEAIANNHDLLTQILVRLPVKSLLRFKSVSKGWYSLISDPAFSCQVFPDEVSGLILYNYHKLDFIRLTDKSISRAPTLTHLNHHHPMRLRILRILQSCNGLLLCCGTFQLPHFHDAYCIYNPTMEEFVELPLPADDHHTIFLSSVAVSLAFDPTNSPHYKVVGVRVVGFLQDFDHEPTCLVYQIEIYSSQTRSWRLSGNTFIAHKTTNFCGGVFWNGAIHWIDECNRDASLYFNVEEEKLQTVPMPSVPAGWEEKPHIAYFGESRDHLHLIQQYEPYLTQFDVYEMKRDYSGWFVKYRVHLDAIRVAFPDDLNVHSDFSCYSYVIFCVVRKANDEDSYMVLHIPGKVIEYNFSDGSFKTIFEFDPDHNDDDGGFPFQPTFKYQVAYQYIPTLCCLSNV
ncbi:hypothetical protein PTKIN_Ptkin05aG0218400 [Pterospermum kingtungense]